MKIIFDTKYGNKRVKVYEIREHYLITYAYWLIPFIIFVSKKSPHANFNLFYAIIPNSIETNIMEELIVHELVHIRQFWTHGCIFYIILYRLSSKFRFRMEMEAFIEQIAFTVNNDRILFLDLIKNKNSPLYKNLEKLFIEEDHYDLKGYVTPEVIQEYCNIIGYNFYHNQMCN